MSEPAINEIETQPRHRSFGTPLDQWIAGIPAELPIDAVGLWQIIPPLRDAFGLDGEALIAATRRVLRALLAAGALPVVGSRTGPGPGPDWRPTDAYGAAPDIIVEGVIASWLASGRDPGLGDLWFALPASCEPDPPGAAEVTCHDGEETQDAA